VLQNEIAMMKISAHEHVVAYVESYIYDKCMCVAIVYFLNRHT
jgi:hypothetical protein